MSESSPSNWRRKVTAVLVMAAVVALAAYVNSDSCSDHDRERLRGMVPSSTYYMLLENLADLRSKRARDYHRVTKMSGEVIDWTGFFDDYDEVDGRTRS